jgi:hypothetical protein
MPDQLRESFADIEALAQRVSWELMDEDQRDAFMTKVVVPRWGKTTSDGVVLKATAWARMVGATVDTIDGRYKRLRRSEAQKDRSHLAPTPNDQAHVRSAKSAIKKHPELAEKLVNDPDVRALVAEHLPAAAIAQRVAEDYDAARAVARNKNAREAVEEEGIPARVTELGADRTGQGRRSRTARFRAVGPTVSDCSRAEGWGGNPSQSQGGPTSRFVGLLDDASPNRVTAGDYLEWWHS